MLAYVDSNPAPLAALCASPSRGYCGSQPSCVVRGDRRARWPAARRRPLRRAGPPYCLNQDHGDARKRRAASLRAASNAAPSGFSPGDASCATAGGPNAQGRLHVRAFPPRTEAAPRKKNERVRPPHNDTSNAPCLALRPVQLREPTLIVLRGNRWAASGLLGSGSPRAVLGRPPFPTALLRTLARHSRVRSQRAAPGGSGQAA